MEIYQKLKRGESKETSEFLQQEYVLPKLGIYKGQVVHFSPLKKYQLQDGASDATKLSEIREKMYAANRNANKKLKQREAVIAKQKDHIASQQEVIKLHECKLKRANDQVEKLRARLNRVNHRAIYWKKRGTEVVEHQSSTKASYKHQIEKLKKELYCLEQDNAEMAEAIESVLQDTQVHTFEGGKYTNDVRACMYELLSLNVGVRNVAPIIRCVLKCLVHKSVSRLPSYGLTCEMILESLVLAQAQLGEELLQTPGSTTLQTDGTTKFGEHFSTFDVRTEEAVTYTLGIRHVFSGSAQNTLETFQEILSDVENVQQALGKSSSLAEIIIKLKNTMSDLHSAENLFNELLTEYRAEILPAVAKNWDIMSENERKQLTRVNNFFCGLHYLVGLADCAEEALKAWEEDNIAQETSGSGTQRLIRTACKAFHHRGSQQCGSYYMFHAYLKGKGIHKIPLAQFVGNCFNILFYDAAGFYFLRDEMIQFVGEIHGTQANRLLQSVRADLKNPCYIVGCRALGLIDKIVTGPIWRKLKESSLSVLDMGQVYCDIKENFDTWSEDASIVLTGAATLKSATVLHKDEVWNSLTESSENDAKTQELLHILFKTFSATTQRLLIDHLPKGKYHSVVGTTIISETASVPTANVSPEHDFAILDRLMRQKPNANAIALVSHWLHKKTEEEKEVIFKAARTLVPATKEKFTARRQAIQKQNEDKLVEKQEDVARKQYKKDQGKEKLAKAIEAIALWTNQTQVDNGLDKIRNKTEKLKILKLQINFRNKMLNQLPSNSSLFKFSQSKKQFTVEQLKHNLCKLLEEESCYASFMFT